MVPNMKIMAFFLGCVLLLAFVRPSQAVEPSGLNDAIFLTPNRTPEFWRQVEESMQAACDSLGVKLEVLNYEDDRIRLLEYAHNIVRRPSKPDIVFLNMITDSDALAVQILNDAKIDVFILNSSFSASKHRALNGPRGEFKHWIGEILPNDLGVATDMARSLYQKAKSNRAKSDAEDQSEIYVGAVQGVAGVRASDARIAGLYRVLTEHDDLKLTEIISGEWLADLSQQAALRLLNYRIKPDIIFAVHDLSAIGVVRAAEESGLVAGVDVLTAGIDWSPDVFPYIKDGRIEASYGGHFMEGAWAVILAYDYKNGYDFKDVEGLTLYSKMERIDASNLTLYEAKIKKKAWLNIDYKALTRTHNTNFTRYNFNLSQLLGITAEASQEP